MNFTLGELFCGPGGIALGASLAKVATPDEEFSITHTWANDYDPDTCETYRRNLSPDQPDSVICADVKTLNLGSLAPIDAFAFGFPCNDFSVVGKHRGIDGVYGPLYAYGVEVLQRLQPQWFLAENVGGLRNANDGAAFHDILCALMESGYTIYPHSYHFEDYGIPQARHRIIIVGIRHDLPVSFGIPKAPNILKTCRAAIENPPIPRDAPNHERTVQAPHVVERLRYIQPGQNAFTADLPEHLRLNIQGVTMSQIYRRLDPTKPAYTVTGSGGGGTHVYHWSENRALTNRERARLQTFPDDFVFYGTKESVRKQIGMALPPAGARILFEAILKSFAGIPYAQEPPNLPTPQPQSAEFVQER